MNASTATATATTTTATTTRSMENTTMSLSFPLRKQLHRLKRTSATWQLGRLPGHLDFKDGERGYVCVCVQGDGKVRAVTTIGHPPTLGTWERLLVEAMIKPNKPMSAQRPAAIRFLDPARATELEISLKGLKIKVSATGDTSILDRVLRDLGAHMAQGKTGLPDEQRALRALSARFINERPWREVSSEEGLQLSLSVPGWRDAVAVVMGSGGETFGLALYRTHAQFLVATSGRQSGDAVEAIESLALLLDDHMETDRGDREPTIFVHNPPAREPEVLHQSHHIRALLTAGDAVLAWVEAISTGMQSDADFSFGDVTVRLLDPPGWQQTMATLDLDDDDDDSDDDDDAIDDRDETIDVSAVKDAKDRANILRIYQLRKMEMTLAAGVEVGRRRRPMFNEALDLLRGLDDSHMPENVPNWICGMPWLIHDVYDGDDTLAMALARKSTDSDMHLWVDANREAVTSVWQVEGLRPGVGVWLRDVNTDDKHFIIDVDASRTAVLHNLMFARIALIDGMAVLVGVHPHQLPGEMQNVLKDALRSLRYGPAERPSPQQLSPQHISPQHISPQHISPVAMLVAWSGLIEVQRTAQTAALQQREVRNTDGDPLLMVEDTYRCPPSEHRAVRAALLALTGAEGDEETSETVVFVRDAAASSQLEEIVLGRARLRGDRLVLSSNSVKRADELRQRVEAAGGRRLRFEGRSLADPMSAAAGVATAAEEAEEAEEVPVGVQEAITAMRLEWRRKWPDERLPALDGKTAREAAALPAMRAKLLAVVVRMETMESRQPVARRLDLAPLRVELGLPPLPR